MVLQKNRCFTGNIFRRKMSQHSRPPWSGSGDIALSDPTLQACRLPSTGMESAVAVRRQIHRLACQPTTRPGGWRGCPPSANDNHHAKKVISALGAREDVEQNASSPRMQGVCRVRYHSTWGVGGKSNCGSGILPPQNEPKQDLFPMNARLAARSEIAAEP